MSPIQAEQGENSRRGSIGFLILESIILNRRKLGAKKVLYLGIHQLKVQLV